MTTVCAETTTRGSQTSYCSPVRKLRAVLGVLVLLAVPLIGVLISVVLIGIAVFLIGATGAGNASNATAKALVFLVILGVIMLVVTVVGLVRALRSKPVTGGAPLPRRRAPELWSIVDSLAATVGVPAPEEIRLVPEVNASVAERTRWLGLRRGHRVLLVGHPLLSGLTIGQLVAVLAHELGHLAGGDTSWGAFAKRGTVAIAHIRDSFRPGALQYTLYSGLLRLFFWVSQSEQRRLELAADRVAAMVTGPGPLADALRRLPGLDAAWRSYLNRVNEVIGATGALPPDLGTGFGEYLAEPSVQRFVADIAEQPDDQTYRLDSHPSTVDRLAALRGLPATGVRADARPATALLSGNPAAAVYQPLLGPAGAGPVLDWPELITRGDAALDLQAARGVLAAAARLTGSTSATPRTVIELMDRGQAARLAGELSGAGGPIDVEPRSEGAELLAAALHSLARAALTSGGRHRYTFHWLGPMVVAGDGTPLPARAHSADVYAVDVLRSAPQDFTPRPAGRTPGASELPTLLLPWMLLRPARAVDLLGYDGSLVLVRRPRAARIRAGARFGLSSRRLDGHLAHIRGMTAAEHAAAGARVIPLDSIASVRMTGELRQVTYVLLRDGSTVKLARDRAGGVTRDMVIGFFANLLHGRQATIEQ